MWTTASTRPPSVLAYRARRCSTNGDRRDVPGVAPTRPRQLHPTQYGRDLVLAARPPCRSDARTATRRHSEASRFTRQDAVLQRPASSGTASSYSSYTPTPDGVTRINERTKKSGTGKFRTRLARRERCAFRRYGSRMNAEGGARWPSGRAFHRKPSPTRSARHGSRTRQVTSRPPGQDARRALERRVFELAEVLEPFVGVTRAP